jgi:hypothetical protein
MGEQDRVATTGFSKMSDRQLGLWDIKVPNQPVGGYKFLDSISGVCMPFWDDGNKILYLAGKGCVEPTCQSVANNAVMATSATTNTKTTSSSTLLSTSRRTRSAALHSCPSAESMYGPDAD